MERMDINMDTSLGDGREEWDKVLDCIEADNLLRLGAYYTNMIRSDVKHLTFTLSRYKFASKLLIYKEDVELLELGCQEAIGALMFQQNINLKTYTGIDFDKRAIEWNRENLFSNMEFIYADFLDCAELGNRKFDAVVSLDVIEHIQPDMEDRYCEVICDKLKGEGTAIIGTPSIMLSPYACEASKIGHINLYDQKRLYELMSKYFHNVFVFNMNDEIVHTGFAPMSCYIFVVCCNKK